jgi:hypothetical protein
VKVGSPAKKILKSEKGFVASCYYGKFFRYLSAVAKYMRECGCKKANRNT